MTGSLTWFEDQTPGTADSDRAKYLDWYKGTIPATWSVPDHVRLIAEHLDGVDSGQIKRLAIHMPPRHGKSETVTVRYPLKFLEENPHDNILVTGYNERFARKFGRRTRNMAVERGLVAEDKSAADEWATRAGGLYMSRGVGSPPTGTGFKRILIDDPIRRREDADSETYREKAWDWYSEDLYSRLEPGGAIILVCTLWHADDVAARAIASEPDEWTVLRLPAINDEGLALWPKRYSVEALEKVRAVMGDYGFEALYQQNPTPKEGALFQPDKITKVSALHIPGPPDVMAIDVGASFKKGDWTAVVFMWRLEGGGTLVEVHRTQLEPRQRNLWLKDLADRRQPKVITFPQDPGAAGKEALQNFVSLLSGHYVVGAPPVDTKETRAHPWASQVNAGLVSIVENACARDYLEELRQFPLGKHDDMVDASSDGWQKMSKPVFRVA